MVRLAEKADVFVAISDPTRREILSRLGGGELTVSELAEPFDMSQPAVSQHLRILREVGLVSQHKEGRFRRYRLNAEALKEVYDWVSHYKRFWTKRLTALGDYLDKQK